MAVETLLHSGSFLDRDGNTIKVSFYKRVDINCYPQGYSGIPRTGGSMTLTIWSHVGDAKLWDPQVDWVTFRQLRAEQLPGSDYYKYTYLITVSVNNSGSARETTLGVGLETGPVVGKLMDVPIKQNG